MFIVYYEINFFICREFFLLLRGNVYFLVYLWWVGFLFYIYMFGFIINRKVVKRIIIKVNGWVGSFNKLC